MPYIPTLSDIQQAAQRIDGKVLRTPLLYSEALTELTGHDIYLKSESLQPGGSFKLRGASNAVALLSDEQHSNGVVTASSGNHGIAVALAAKRAGIVATIVLPGNAPDVKVQRIEQTGATIIKHGMSYGDAEEHAHELAKQGMHYIHAYDIPEVIAGQGTIALEIDTDAPDDLDSVLVAVGGGGLISGIALGMRYKRPSVRVVGAEPEQAASLTAAMRANEPVAIEAKPTCADGLLPRYTGDISLVVHENGPWPVLLTEDDLLAGVRFCLDELRLVAEPSGAAAVAALVSGKFKPSGATVAVISGSNLDRKWLRAALQNDTVM